MDQDFLGEENHCRQVFFILIVQWSIEEDNTKGGKVAKDKGKTLSFKLRFDRDFFVQIWTPAWSSASTSHFHDGFFFLLQNGTLSLFFGPVFFFSFFF